MKRNYSREYVTYEEGRYAHAEGLRRGENPYAATGDQKSCLSWWQGWDDEEERETEAIEDMVD